MGYSVCKSMLVVSQYVLEDCANSRACAGERGLLFHFPPKTIKLLAQGRLLLRGHILRHPSTGPGEAVPLRRQTQGGAQIRDKWRAVRAASDRGLPWPRATGQSPATALPD